MENVRIRTNSTNAGCLFVSDEAIGKLQDRVFGMERAIVKDNTMYAGKACPTRHGCKGATNCDYSYGDYPY